MERAGGGAVSHNHTHSVYTCLYSLYRNTPQMCVMWTWILSDLMNVAIYINSFHSLIH